MRFVERERIGRAHGCVCYSRCNETVVAEMEQKRKVRDGTGRVSERMREREEGGRRGFAGPRACCNGKRSRGEEARVALSSLMNIQFCLVRPLAGSAGVVIPAAGPVTIIAITRGNRAAHPSRSPASQFSSRVALPSDITRNTIEQVEPIGTIARRVCLFPL